MKKKLFNKRGKILVLAFLCTSGLFAQTGAVECSSGQVQGVVQQYVTSATGNYHDALASNSGVVGEPDVYGGGPDDISKHILMRNFTSDSKPVILNFDRPFTGGDVITFYAASYSTAYSGGTASIYLSADGNEYTSSIGTLGPTTIGYSAYEVTIPSNYTGSYTSIKLQMPYSSSMINIDAVSVGISDCVCDTSIATGDCDNDGIPNGKDCFPNDPNSLQDTLDSDGDGIPNMCDLDDDNDGILDDVECPGAKKGMNLITDGGFTKGDLTSLYYPESTGWYLGFETLNYYQTIYTDAYEWAGNRQYMNWANSNVTGGLFDRVNGPEANADTGTRSIGFIHDDPKAGMVYNFGELCSGTYEYAFDLRARLENTGVGGFEVYVLNLDTPTNKTDDILLNSGTLGQLYGYPNDSGPLYHNFNGTFTITEDGRYALVFKITDPGTAIDLLIDRVAVVGNQDCSCDTDGDGIPDYLDLDSDGDGCYDAIEGTGGFSSSDLNANGSLSGQVDANGVPVKAEGGQGKGVSADGTQQAANCEDTTAIDTDGDGIPDSIDLDDDNDGIPDTVEESTAPANGDTDGDGIPDSLDLDSDNDGIPDLEESGLSAGEISALDKNNDGVIDASNEVGSNGIADAIESGNTDGGVASNAVDYNNDGTTDAPEDTDGDGIPDFQDKDSDNDGITDLVEGGTDPSLDRNHDGVIDNGTDSDGDGIADVIDDNPTNFGGDESNGAPDTDGDGIPDYQDLDSDDDGINDVEEAGLPDTNGDGQDDTPNTSFAGGDDLPDTDGDNIPDYKDPNGPVITGPDTDGDGIKDSEDGNPDEFGDAVFPDFTIQISSRPAAITNGGKLSVRVNVVEITGNPSLEGKPIVVRIPEEAFFDFNFDSSLTQVSGLKVNNSDWEYLGKRFGLHTFSYKPATFEGLTSSAIGFEGIVNFEGVSSTSISAYIVDSSGGEVNFTNNRDTEKLNLKD